MICSLGDSLEEIVDAVRHKRIKLEQLPFTLAGLPYTRPYYLIMRDEKDKLDNRSEAYFYEILFSTVARAISDAGLSGAEIRDMHLFFGSTSMDVPVFEGNHRKVSSTVSGMFLQSSNGYGKIAGAVDGEVRNGGKLLFLYHGMHVERQRLALRRIHDRGTAHREGFGGGL